LLVRLLAALLISPPFRTARRPPRPYPSPVFHKTTLHAMAPPTQQQQQAKLPDQIDTKLVDLGHGKGRASSFFSRSVWALFKQLRRPERD
jgi:hypothetical protein